MCGPRRRSRSGRGIGQVRTRYYPARSYVLSRCSLADPPTGIGGVLGADRVYLGNPDGDVPDHPFWGPTVNATELAPVAREDGQTVEEIDDGALIERIADDLMAGRVVGWMEGASELGPRAIVAFWPHRTRDTCATGSTARSSIAKSSGPLHR